MTLKYCCYTKLFLPKIKWIVIQNENFPRLWYVSAKSILLSSLKHLYLLVSVVGKFRGLFSLSYKFRHFPLCAWEVHWLDIWYLCHYLSFLVNCKMDFICRICKWRELINEISNSLFPLPYVKLLARA